jgi:hypothetical protein
MQPTYILEPLHEPQPTSRAKVMQHEVSLEHLQHVAPSTPTTPQPQTPHTQRLHTSPQIPPSTPQPQFPGAPTQIWLASLLIPPVPIGPRSGRTKCPWNTSQHVAPSTPPTGVWGCEVGSRTPNHNHIPSAQPPIRRRKFGLPMGPRSGSTKCP